MPVNSAPSTQQMLGIRFFVGTAEQAVYKMQRDGGMLVAPSGTCFGRLQEDPAYRAAIIGADCALADSGLMVLLWKLLRGGEVTRVSGLRYLQTLCAVLTRAPDTVTLSVVPNGEARELAQSWLRKEGLDPKGEIYVAPVYERTVEDAELLRIVDAHRPAHIIIGIGAGPQEKLGAYLRDHASYRPAIHCIGGALGVLTGHQRPIPVWADRIYAGWLFRLVAQPRVFFPRLLRAWKLPWLITRYGRNLPPVLAQSASTRAR